MTEPTAPVSQTSNERAKEKTLSEASTTRAKAKSREASHAKAGEYVLPLVHIRLSPALVDGGFWGGLAGAVAVGAIDPPLGVLIGAGVIIARHQSRS